MDIRKIVPTLIYLQMQYFYHFKKFFNLKNPKTLNEKLQWLKINFYDEKYTKLVDKIEVKKYIANKIGKKYIIPTYKVWGNANEINLDDLPEKFILKCNHDSHCFFICTDKKTFKLDEVKRSLNKRLKRNAFFYGREWPYKNIKPKIFAEKLLENDDIYDEIVDYKILCINGKIDHIMICMGRKQGNPRFYYFDKNWKFLKYQEIDKKMPDNFSLPKPKYLNEMFEIAERLSINFPIVRVDLYEADNQVWFGELTFFPCCGYDKDITLEADTSMGNKLILPPQKKIKGIRIKNILKKIYCYIFIFRTIIPIISLFIDSELKNNILLDLKRLNNEINLKNKIIFFNYSLLRNICFRNIFYYRLLFKKHYLLYYISILFLSHKNKIEIGGEIKGGFCIYHGVGDILYLNKAGTNLSVYQNVTLGRNPRTEKDGVCVPTIGNNVSIYANAVVIGNIKIGNNVEIGAGTIVTKDVPDNSTVVGNPMRIIRKL